MAATTALPRPKAYDDTFFKPISLWLTTTDHKLIGIMYMVTAMISFVIGGIFALVIRLQLSLPNLRVVDDSTYNQIISAHGVTMIFFFVTIFVTGIANYMVPIMVGARDMAFPRVNLLGFWLVPVSIILYYCGFFTGRALDAGWTGYAPLTEKAFQSHSLGVDFWAMSIIVWAISGIMASTNFLTTIVALRAPGMRFSRLPLFVWAQISTSILLLVVGAPLAAAMILLEFDRQVGTQFFTTAGRPVLYQHLFWFFGHPEVYVMILPAFGMISEIVPVFARKPIFGYMSMVAALFGIVFLSMTVWAHHMFTVGMNTYVEGFFMLMTMLIAVPTGIKFFNWIATAWWGSIEFTVPIKFVFGFLATFLIGGITGIYLASVPVDTQLHQSYFVVAHLHYVLFGGSVFAIFAGIYYWFPKITGRLLNNALGEWHFWLTFIGFNGTFLIMHTLGLEGMPRRIWTYSNESWALTNTIITLSSFLIAVAVLVFLINIVRSWNSGEIAGNDPWQGNTLEWATTSPPPPYNFERVPPVRSFMPVRDLRESGELVEEPPVLPAPA
ncbi:MAG TPA: cytochrome c oxidase subunit I [Candidatus Dormibacteraeota bacterium]|nr:cytochrome c oxidase subunit I [Candidatus Dormibacteraeota bacterium]